MTVGAAPGPVGRDGGLQFGVTSWNAEPTSLGFPRGSMNAALQSVQRRDSAPGHAAGSATEMASGGTHRPDAAPAEASSGSFSPEIPARHVWKQGQEGAEATMATPAPPLSSRDASLVHWRLGGCDGPARRRGLRPGLGTEGRPRGGTRTKEEAQGTSRRPSLEAGQGHRKPLLPAPSSPKCFVLGPGLPGALWCLPGGASEHFPWQGPTFQESRAGDALTARPSGHRTSPLIPP